MQSGSLLMKQGDRGLRCCNYDWRGALRCGMVVESFFSKMVQEKEKEKEKRKN